MNSAPNHIPLALYIHIPWCVRKCPYCDFNSHQNKNFSEQQYIQALLDDFEQEIKIEQQLYPDTAREISSVFFGGGTPSLFSAQAIKTILNHLQQLRKFSDNCEITLEANPGTADISNFSGYKNAGVNRLSIGVQSFNDNHLKILGRVHSHVDAKLALQMARDAGFDNVNLDLMHGLPQQTLSEAISDLNTAISLQPEHISWYQLTIEPNTIYYSQPPKLPDSILLEEIDAAGKKLLGDNGYEQYEISAYSQAKKQAQHNLNYWQFADYIGIGAGAHGKLSDIKNKKIIRRQKTRLPEDYLSVEKAFLAKQQEPQGSELILEFMMNALRLKNGSEKSLFEQRTFMPASTIDKKVEQLIRQGLLENCENRLKTTDKGFDFLNQVLDSFL